MMYHVITNVNIKDYAVEYRRTPSQDPQLQTSLHQASVLVQAVDQTIAIPDCVFASLIGSDMLFWFLVPGPWLPPMKTPEKMTTQ